MPPTAILREDMSIFIRRIMAFCAIGVSILGTGHGASAQANGKVVVFAAASLATALNAIQPIFAKDTGKTVVISYGSSGVLAKQIEQGAPADVFISADTKWVDYLQRKIFSRKGRGAIFWATISFWSSRPEAIRILRSSRDSISRKPPATARLPFAQSLLARRASTPRRVHQAWRLERGRAEIGAGQ